MALRYLHAAGLVHRAVEPAAVLLRSEPSDPRGFVAKLASFGLATRGNAVPPPSTTSSPVAPGAAAAAAAAGGSARPSASSVGSAPLHDGAAAAAALTPPLASGGLVGPVHCIPPEAYYGAWVASTRTHHKRVARSANPPCFVARTRYVVTWLCLTHACQRWAQPIPKPHPAPCLQSPLHLASVRAWPGAAAE